MQNIDTVLYCLALCNAFLTPIRNANASRISLFVSAVFSSSASSSQTSSSRNADVAFVAFRDDVFVEINGTPVDGLMNEEVAELMVKQDEAILLLSDDTKLYNGRVIHEN